MAHISYKTVSDSLEGSDWVKVFDSTCKEIAIGVIINCLLKEPSFHVLHDDDDGTFFSSNTCHLKIKCNDRQTLIEAYERYEAIYQTMSD
jgi:hypothetical protein